MAAATLTFPDDRAALSTWAPVVVGLAALYVPTYLDVAKTFWATERDSHGPIVLATWFWLLWRERAALLVEQRTATGSALGWALISVGALLYAVGRSQQMFQLEVGSQLALLPGVLLVLLGPQAVRRLWFVLLFLVFVVPLPGSIVDTLLVPMKELVAASVTQLLFHAGLPIARDGVVIYAGNYQLFIADACSGLNQLVALTAVGVVYAYVARHASKMHTGALLAAIVPIALLANLVRVVTLVLATYLGGDRLGHQLHDYAGYLEIVLAFGAFFVLDCILRGMTRRNR